MNRIAAVLGAFRAADWLSLAAAPTFALMAAVTGVDGGGGGQHMSCMHLSGMAPMYLLMSGFHCFPWLKLLAHWRGGACAA